MDRTEPPDEVTDIIKESISTQEGFNDRPQPVHLPSEPPLDASLSPMIQGQPMEEEEPNNVLFDAAPQTLPSSDNWSWNPRPWVNLIPIDKVPEQGRYNL